MFDINVYTFALIFIFLCTIFENERGVLKLNYISKRFIKWRLDENLRRRLETTDVAALFDCFVAEDMPMVYKKLDEGKLEVLLMTNQSLVGIKELNKNN